MQALLLKVSAQFHFTNATDGKFCTKLKVWEFNSSATLDLLPFLPSLQEFNLAKGDMERNKR